MKRKIVTAFMMAALGSSLVFSQVVMAADTSDKTEASAETDESSAEADDADKDAKDEELKTIGEKPEEDTEGVFSAKLKNLTGKVITGVSVKNETEEAYPDNFLTEEDKFETEEERILWFDPNAEEKTDDTKDAAETETADQEEAKTEEKSADDKKDADEKEIPKYNIQLTFEDGTTAELHTFPFGDTEEAELHLDGDVAYLIFDSISQKKEYNTLETEKELAPKPTEAAVETTTQSSSQNDSYDYSNDYDYNNDDYDYSNDDYDYSNDDYDYSNDDYDYNNDDSDYDGSDDGDSGDSGDDGGTGCLDDGLLN